MSNFKVNEVVRIKATGETGVIKAREVINLENNRNKIEYIVRLGEGFENWKSFNRNELVKINSERPNTDKLHYKVYNVSNGYTVVMVAETQINRELEWSYYDEDKCVTIKNKDFRMGYAICNPDDEFNLETGIKLARHRMIHSPFCKLNSSFTGEFNVATIDALLDVKAHYIINNLDKFVKK